MATDLSSFSGDDWVDHSVHGSVFYDGVKFNALVIPSSLEALKTFDVREDDIWINTYSKSGTHWASEIVHLILNNGNPETIDRTTTQGNIEMIYGEKDSYDEGKTRHLPFYKIIERAPSPRILQTHLPVKYLPPGIDNKKAKVIYVARNPKDVITSLDRFVGNNEMGDFIRWQGALKEFMDGTRNYGSWFEHVKTSWNLRHQENRLFIKYEDMKKDPRNAILTISRFLERPLSDETLEKIVEYSSFKGMKKTYDKVEAEGKAELVKAVGTHSYMNKGVIASWKKRFTVSENEEFNRVYKEKMADTDLQFDFE
ncbi:sulfotransferase family cytosolic 1B member 1 [Strongylocentrotus purpuratus]|uniref:Sulfotransferase domain-containing protein n=1 Tax=Strongylocentrotus purpuratus TaxID=7668 RepID=A0A7M7PI38_STRPU|nr:sulfotransferase family cytosolic 1B member 1 [Strongylocentrotus purpuratus]